jgi:hypothetical protein
MQVPTVPLENRERAQGRRSLQHLHATAAGLAAISVAMLRMSEASQRLIARGSRVGCASQCIATIKNDSITYLPADQPVPVRGDNVITDISIIDTSRLEKTRWSVSNVALIRLLMKIT